MEIGYETAVAFYFSGRKRLYKGNLFISFLLIGSSFPGV